jgi:hypothetical protein
MYRIVRDGKLWYIVDEFGKNANGDKAFHTLDDARSAKEKLPTSAAKPVQSLNRSSEVVKQKKSKK